MVPNNTRQIEAMPLTKNGKIDRAELAARGRIKM
jgi:acyl-coenzyme A synthetase/AMP-(fatty) acid ligase